MASVIKYAILILSVLLSVSFSSGVRLLQEQPNDDPKNMDAIPPIDALNPTELNGPGVGIHEDHVVPKGAEIRTLGFGFEGGPDKCCSSGCSGNCNPGGFVLPFPQIPEIPRIPEIPQIPQIPQIPLIPQIPQVPLIPLMPGQSGCESGECCRQGCGGSCAECGQPRCASGCCQAETVKSKGIEEVMDSEPSPPK
ncbi:hypothetical protein CXB51_034238 [Gossypium anomalum]|uniref:Uncharacterized protein n=1 Tax=Gossypium anomalum TaxID=47600 RepID=A0A8J5XW22_9ROSI|nr:hypothetical protein CXB51_034238 [Gossypium anomalum]